MDLSAKVTDLQANLANALGEHFRLVWLAGGTASERSVLLRALAEAEDGVFIEVGKSMSEALIEIPVPLRTASVEDSFAQSLVHSAGNVACLDHLEVLFEPSLRINPVALIQRASRYTLLAASWPGTVEGGRLTFGPPGHPAHTEIPERDLESVIHFL